MSWFRYVWLLIISALLAHGCRERPAPVAPQTPAPRVQFDSVQVVSNVVDTAAQVRSVLRAGGGQPVARVGHVWSMTNPTPTLTNARSEFTTSAAGGAPAPTTFPLTISSTLTELVPEQTFFVRPYATDARGTTTYGPVVEVKTTVRRHRPGNWLAYTGVLLDEAMRGRNIGYAFTIYQRGQLVAAGSRGLRARPIDWGSAQPYTIDTRMHVASISKTITAIALLRLLGQKRIGLSDSIGPYLPKAWPRGPGIGRTTFEQLLTHRSGLVGMGDNCLNGAASENVYAGLRQLVRKGILTRNVDRYCYQNANYGLFRVLIPALMGYRFEGEDSTDDQQTQRLYTQYVQEQVLRPAGVLNGQTSQPSDAITFSYDFPYTGIPGWNPGTFPNTIGGYGWHLTPRETGQVFARILASADESVLTGAQKNLLLTQGLGCFRGSTAAGTVRYHDGWWYTRPGTEPYRGVRTLWISFPDNVVIVLFTNALNQINGLFPSDDGTDIVPFVVRLYTQALSWRENGGRRAAEQQSDGPTTYWLEHPEPH